MDMRATTVWRSCGIGGGLIAAGVAVGTSALGRGVLLAAPLCGFGILMGVLLGELALSPPSGPMRRAALEVRRVRDYVPRRLTAVLGVATAALVSLLAVTTALGSPDDLGRPGRSLTRVCSAALSESHGPWPGSFYSIPLAIVLLAGLTATVLTLRRIVIRPRLGDPVAMSQRDDAMRRRSAHTSVGAYGVTVILPLVAVSLVSASGLLAIDCRPAAWTVAGWSLLALLPVWLVVLAWSLRAIVAPHRARAAP
jgi:hypothetical protein